MLQFLIGVAREGLSDVAFESRPQGNEGSKSWECQEESIPGWENSRAKALGQEWTCLSGISRGQRGWGLGMEREKVVDEVRLGEKQARLGHDEELDILAGINLTSVSQVPRHPLVCPMPAEQTRNSASVNSAFLPLAWLPSLYNGETGPIHSLCHSGNSEQTTAIPERSKHHQEKHARHSMEHLFFSAASDIHIALPPQSQEHLSPPL